MGFLAPPNSLIFEAWLFLIKPLLSLPHYSGVSIYSIDFIASTSLNIRLSYGSSGFVMN